MLLQLLDSVEQLSVPSCVVDRLHDFEVALVESQRVVPQAVSFRRKFELRTVLLDHPLVARDRSEYFGQRVVNERPQIADDPLLSCHLPRHLVDLCVLVHSLLLEVVEAMDHEHLLSVKDLHHLLAFRLEVLHSVVRLLHLRLACLSLESLHARLQQDYCVVELELRGDHSLIRLILLLLLLALLPVLLSQLP